MTEASQVVVPEVAMFGLPTMADEARSRLDPAAFQLAYEAGRSMDRRTIIAYSIAGLAKAGGN
jgi:hypothetical protein